MHVNVNLFFGLPAGLVTGGAVAPLVSAPAKMNKIQGPVVQSNVSLTALTLLRRQIA